MTARSIDAASDAQVAIEPGDIIPLDPNDIELGERLRPIDEKFAAWLGGAMARDGQIHPVDVVHRPDGKWRLAGAGGHRVTGARLAGIPVEARVLLIDDATARRREAAENLFRRANDPVERATAIAELARLHRERAGIEEVKHRDESRPRRFKEEAEETLEMISNVYGWSEEIGAEVGLTGRTVRNDLLLYRRLKPSVISLLREHRHSILKNAAQLATLARRSHEEQEEIASRLVDSGPAGARSVGEAIRLTKGEITAKKTPEQKRFQAVLGNLQRMPPAERKAAFHHMRTMVPAGWWLASADDDLPLLIALRDAIDARIWELGGAE